MNHLHVPVLVVDVQQHLPAPCTLHEAAWKQSVTDGSTATSCTHCSAD